MNMKMNKCPDCKIYTMEDACPQCGGELKVIYPPKFSIEDKYGKYQVHCHLINPETRKSKYEYLGYYETELEAFKVYKYHKERNIKEVADYFKKQISEILYNGLYEYEVEITD